MHKLWINNRRLIVFVARFLFIFGVLYFGTLAMIGLAAPGGWYSPFVEAHLDYVAGLKRALMSCAGAVLRVFGIATVMEPGFLLRIVGGRAVFIAMSCVGYGVYSFWIAYVAANAGSLKAKLTWIIGGLLALWTINVVRIALFLVVVNRNSSMPLGIDHHTWFNIAAYGLIFLMMWWYEKRRGGWMVG